MDTEIKKNNNAWNPAPRMILVKVTLPRPDLRLDLDHRSAAAFPAELSAVAGSQFQNVTAQSADQECFAAN